MTNRQILEYVQDATGFKLNAFYGPTVVLSILMILNIIGLFGKIYPEINPALGYFASIGHPAYFFILWVVMMAELFVKTQSVSEKLSDIHHANPEVRVLAYIALSTLGIGFGIIFGTLGLFSNPETISEWGVWFASLIFPIVCTIMARGYIRESPIVNFFTNKIISKFPKLGFLW